MDTHNIQKVQTHLPTSQLLACSVLLMVRYVIFMEDPVVGLLFSHVMPMGSSWAAAREWKHKKIEEYGEGWRIWLEVVCIGASGASGLKLAQGA